MTPLQVLQLVSALYTAATDAKKVVDDLKAKGHMDNVPIPPEHEQKIQDILNSLPIDTEWNQDHENSGG